MIGNDYILKLPIFGHNNWENLSTISKYLENVKNLTFPFFHSL